MPRAGYQRALAQPYFTGWRQPSGLVEIDWSHPLANGLVGAWMPSPCNGLRDLSRNGNNLVLKSAAQIIATATGTAVTGTAATMGADTNANAALQLTGNLSMFWHGVIAADCSGESWFMGVLATTGDTTPFTGYGIGRNSASSQANLTFEFNNAGTAKTGTYTSTANTSYGKPSNICLSAIAAGTVAMYLNGVDQGVGTFTQAYAGTQTFTTPLVCISNYTSEPTRFSGANTSLALIYNRALSVEESMWLSRQPFAMFRPVFVYRGKLAGIVNSKTISLFTGSSVAAAPRQMGKIVNPAGSSAIILPRQAGKTTRLAVGSSVTLQRQDNKVINFPGPARVSLVAGATRAKTLLLTQASVISLVRQSGRIMALGTTSGLVLQRQIAKLITLSQGHAVILVRQVAKQIVITAGSSLSLTIGKALSKVIALVSGSATQLATAASHLRTIVVQSGETLALTRQVQKLVLVQQGLALSLRRQTAKLITIIAGSLVTLVSIKAYLRTILVAANSVVTLLAAAPHLRAISIAAGSVVTLAKQTAKTLLVNTASVLVLQRQIAKLILVMQASAVTLNAIKVKLAGIIIATGSVVTLGKQIGKGLTLQAGSNVTLARQNVKLILLQAGHVLRISRQLPGGITLKTGRSLTLQTGKAFIRTLVLAANSVLAKVVQVGKPVGIATVGLSILNKNVARSFRIAAALVVVLQKSAAKIVTLPTNSSVVLTAVRGTLSRTLTIVGSSVATLARQAQKTIPFPTSSVLVLTRQSQTGISILQSTVVTLASHVGGFGHTMTLTIGGSSFVTALAQFLRRLRSVLFSNETLRPSAVLFEALNQPMPLNLRLVALPVQGEVVTSSQPNNEVIAMLAVLNESVQ